MSKENKFSIISNFINTSLNNYDNRETALIGLKKISTFLTDHHYQLSPDMMIDLITKNTLFNKIISIVVKNYYQKIVDGYSEYIFDDNFIIDTITSYCMLNSIDIKDAPDESPKVYFDELAASDSLKTYLSEISHYPLLKTSEEKELLLAIRNGNLEAKEKFIKCNLKLVVKVAKRYYNQGLTLLDLIQEGNIGLITAIDHYNPEKGFKFSTYAIYWIKQSIIRAIDNKGRNVRIPTHTKILLCKYQKTYKLLESKLLREPTTEELANELNLSIKNINLLKSIMDDTISLNISINEEDDELAYLIPSDEPTPEEIVIDRTLAPVVDNFLKNCHLKERELEIIKYRYGFYNHRIYTLEELGTMFGVSKERIRQIESYAINALRKENNIKELALYTSAPVAAIEYINNRVIQTKYYQSPYKSSKEKNHISNIDNLNTLANKYTQAQIKEALEELTPEEIIAIDNQTNLYQEALSKLNRILSHKNRLTKKK